MCSSNVVDNAERCYTTKVEKSSVVPPFLRLRSLPSAPKPLRERVIHKRVENRSFSKAVSLQLYEKFKGRTKV